MQIKDRAICLRAVNYSETSQVVTLLTREHGKIAAMAKGSRRAKNAFDGPIEVFSCGEILFIVKESGGLAVLTEFNQEPHFRGLSQNLDALNAALFGTELTERFLEDHDPHPPLFDKFIKFLETIQETTQNNQILARLILYQLRLLEETGIGLMLDACANCGTTARSTSEGTGMWPKHPASEIKNSSGTAYPAIYFSSHKNGLLCSACESAFVEKRAINSKIPDILQHPAKLSKTDAKLLKETEQLMVYHFTELLGKPPKMAKYFM